MIFPNVHTTLLGLCFVKHVKTVRFIQFYCCSEEPQSAAKIVKGLIIFMHALLLLP